MRKLVIALLLVSNIFGCAEYSEKRDVAQRKQVVSEWIAAGDEVAARSGNQAAAKIMEILKNESVFIFPREYKESSGSKVFFEVVGKLPAKPYRIGITSLSKKDRSLGELWQKIFDSNNYAFLYVPEGSKKFSVLVLKEDRITSLWRGLILIHEASHAVAHSMGTFDEIEDVDLKNAYYELATYTLQGEIIAQLGGKAYTVILEREVERLKNETKKGKGVSSGYSLYQQELDEIFGKAESSREQEMRSVVFWFDAMLHMCDSYGKEAIKNKLFFLVESHKDAGKIL